MGRQVGNSESAGFGKVQAIRWSCTYNLCREWTVEAKVEHFAQLYPSNPSIGRFSKAHGRLFVKFTVHTFWWISGSSTALMLQLQILMPGNMDLSRGFLSEIRHYYCYTVLLILNNSM
ncbi:hypothetical protein N7G274_003613 [Stereocaulon virgatum]|uniref:Uncharacterized protein n=1 Tax=Stereocaulon virgatum TaxID=373712 RepID=A0ABR4AFD7_9LECA